MVGSSGPAINGGVSVRLDPEELIALEAALRRSLEDYRYDHKENLLQDPTYHGMQLLLQRVYEWQSRSGTVSVRLSQPDLDQLRACVSKAFARRGYVVGRAGVMMPLWQTRQKLDQALEGRTSRWHRLLAWFKRQWWRLSATRVSVPAEGPRRPRNPKVDT